MQVSNSEEEKLKVKIQSSKWKVQGCARGMPSGKAKVKS
jgi:hypothetical protein